MIHRLTPDYILQRFARGATAGDMDAVCLFVDISGFTPLTLALMEHGAEGAEVLADVLVTVFEPLIHAVYAYDGFIAGFAGDAFKALFPLDRPHAVDRAVSAAWTIGARLQRAPEHITRFGAFQFSGKACVAMGPVRWEVWQAGPGLQTDAQHHAAYLFRGAGLDAAMQLDPLAERGEIVLSANVAAALTLAAATSPVQSSPRDGAHQLAALTPRPQHADHATPPAVDLASARPFYPQTLLTTPIQGEFRRVTTAFVNLAEGLDAHTQARFTADFFRLLAQYNGFLCRIGRIGGKDDGHTFLLFWGAPTSSERDVDRALSFLLDLQAASPVPLRAGVTTELAYAGFVGSPRREEYTCYGTYVNLAARQLIMAAWGEIWLDRNTAQAASAFACRAHGTHTFKGFATPRPCFVLTGRRDPGETPQSDGTLVGRSRELAQLTAAVQPLATRQFAGATVIVGEAGMGKSRLTAALAAGIHGSWPAAHRPVFHTIQTDDIVRESLNPWRHWLRRLFQLTDQPDAAARLAHFNTMFQAIVAATPDLALAAELERTHSFLAALVDITWDDSLYSRLEPELRYENTLHALRALVRALSSQQPLVLVVEDAHWFDTASREFVHGLLTSADDSPFAMVMTMRPPEKGALDLSGLMPASAQGDVIHLQPLPADAVGALIEATLGGAVAPALADRLVRQGDGNPFFTEQIMLYLREQGLLRHADGMWSLDTDVDAQADAVLLSGDVRAVLTARLDRLEPSLKLAVQTAAVLGREFDVDILAHMLRPETRAEGLLTSGEQAGIWARHEQGYLFRHALLRDAAYDMQLRARLRGLHLRAAVAVETVHGDNLAPWYAELAHHFNRGEDRANERTYARLAGMRAAEQFANDAAVRHLSRALELTPDDEHAPRRELLRRRTEVYNTVGDRTAQAADLGHLLQLARSTGSAHDVADALLRRAEYARVLTDYAAAERDLVDATAHADRIDDPVLLSKLFNCWGRVLWRQGSYTPARAKLAEAFQLAQRADATGELADIYYQIGCIDYYEVKYDDALGNFQLAFDLYDAAAAPKGKSLCLSMFGAIHYQAGRYRASETAYLESLEISNALGWRHTSAFLYGLLGTNYLDMGAFDRTRHYHEQALRLCRELGDREGEAISLDALGLEASLRGEHTHAIDEFMRAAAIQRAIGDRRSLAYTLTHAGHAYMGTGDAAQARRAFEEATSIRVELAETGTLQDSRAGLALALLHQGHVADAVRTAQEIITWIGDNDPTTMEYPAHVYLICAQVCAAADKPAIQAQADALRAAGRALVLSRAAGMDEDARADFMQAIPFHAALMATEH